MSFIGQLEKEHEVLRGLLVEIESLGDFDCMDLEKFKFAYLKLYALWGVHEKKEEENFSKVKVVNIDKYVARVFEDHRKLRPYKESIRKAIDRKKDSETRESFERNFEWLRDQLLEHLTYEESYLFTILGKYSDNELGFL